jgi:hypothetical protein
MTSTVDLSTALAPAAARFDRQREDARQQHWMAELEQAMLAQQLQPQQRPAEPGRTGEGLAQDGVTAASAGTGSSSSASMQGAARSAAQAQSPAPAHQQAAGARQPADPGSAPQGKARQEAGGVPAEAGAVAAGLEYAAPSAGAAANAMAAAGYDGALAARMALSTGSPANAAAAADRIEAVQAPKGSALPTLGGAAGAFAAAPGETLAWESNAAASAAEADAAPGEEYEKQLLHLFHGDDGVHAYIRDAELTGARLRAVAQALAVELNGGGSRLTGLTVNGRRVSIAGGSQHEEERPATASEAAPLPIIQKGSI